MTEGIDFASIAAEEAIEDIYGYTERPIDVDAGVTMRNTPAPGYVRVIMYKSMPGLYLDVKGRPLPDKIAKQAGFDVVGDRKKARVEYEVRLATASIRKRQLEVEHEIRSQTTPEARVRLGSIPDLSPPPAPPLTLDPQLDYGVVTDFNASDRPRGTKNYVMEGGAGGIWNVVNRETRVQIATRVSTAQAEEVMIQAQMSDDRT